MENEPIVYHRLSAVAYRSLSKEVKAMVPGIPKNDIEAGFSCGVEFVLRLLREGYAVQPE